MEVLVQRDGRARPRALTRITLKDVRGFIAENVDLSNSALLADEAKLYKGIGRVFAGGHHVVNHSKGEFARGSTHSDTVESFRGLFKRAINRAWHHISREHIGRCLDEQCFRWTFRKVTDGERTLAALDRVGGVRLSTSVPRKPSRAARASWLVGEGAIKRKRPPERIRQKPRRSGDRALDSAHAQGKAAHEE